MKTAISLPDALFEAADRMAKRLSMTRSELYARALAAYVKENDGEQITRAIDVALSSAGSMDCASELTHLGARSVGPDEGPFEEWVAAPRRRARRK